MSINRGARLLLMAHDGLEEAVEMLILTVIVLDELFKAVRQVGP